jgi:hypothetical protein
MICCMGCVEGAAEYAVKSVTTDILVQYGSQTVPSISEQANVALNGTTVTGTTCVFGSLTASDAELGPVVVHGTATIVNSTINGPISVHGELQLQNCQVNGEISTYSSRLTLSSTNASSIVNLSEGGQQTITLRNGSNINGAISFQSGNGTVALSDGSYFSGLLSGGRSVKG